MKALLFASALTLFSVFAFADELVLATPATETVPVAAPAAPPKWVEDVAVSVQEVPVIGPIATKVMGYLVMVGTILTAFTAFMFTTLTALMRVFNWAGLVKLSNALSALRGSKLMYWISLFSNIPLKKPEPAIKLETTQEKAA